MGTTDSEELRERLAMPADVLFAGIGEPFVTEPSTQLDGISEAHFREVMARAWAQAANGSMAVGETTSIDSV